MECIAFPGPGNGHYVTFNPIQEFIHPTVDDHVEEAFHHFRNKHNIAYNTQHAHEYRKNIFRQNLRFINSHNRGNLTYKLGINHLADKTENELRALRGYRSSGVYNGGKSFPYDVSKFRNQLPEQYDWRLIGAVSPVKGNTLITASTDCHYLLIIEKVSI